MEEDNFLDEEDPSSDRFAKILAERARRGRKIFLIGIFLGGLVLILGGGIVFGKIFGGAGYLADLGSAFSESFGETFGFKEREPVFEVDLANFDGEGEILPAPVGIGGTSFGQDKNDGEDKTEPEKSDKNTLLNNQLDDQSKKETARVQPSVSECDFYASASASRKVLFSEVAWMGNDFSANDEWMELFNNSSRSVDLSGWRILSEGGKIEIVFDQGGVPERSFYTLERTDDNSIPNLPADKIYSGALANGGEWLKLFDQNCELVDEVNAASGWENLGGDNETKKTLERNLASLAWQTSGFANGTPKKINSNPSPSAQVDSTGSPQATSTLPAPSEATSSEFEPPPPPPSQNQETVKVLISEVMAGSSLAADDEFIEIYNSGSEAVDLTGWSIKKKSSTGSESTLVAMSRLEGKSILAGKYFLLAHEEGYTGAVSPNIWWPKSYTLAYTNNSILMYDASGAVIDQVAWTDIPKDKSYARTSLDISAGFGVTESPSPTNSGM